MSIKEKLPQFFQTTPVLIIFSLIIIISETYTVPIYIKFFGKFDLTQLAPLVFIVGYFLLLSFSASCVFIKLLMQKNLADFGFQLPKNLKLAILLIVCALLVLVPYITYFSIQSSFQSYSLSPTTIPKFIFITAILFPLFYLSEEFFFRGFLFIGLWNRVGWHSFWITDIIFTLAHLGKPWLEVLLCIPASVILNGLTLATRSILPAIIVHCSLGVILSTLVTFKLLS